VQSDGAIVRISDNHEGKVLDVAEIARVPGGTNVPDYLSGEVRLRVADLDNNGALDLVPDWCIVGLRSPQHLWGMDLACGPKKSKFVLLGASVWAAPAPALISGAADLTGDGRLDLLALSCRRTTVASRQSRFEGLSLASCAAARTQSRSVINASIPLWRGRRD